MKCCNWILCCFRFFTNLELLDSSILRTAQALSSFWVAVKELQIRHHEKEALLGGGQGPLVIMERKWKLLFRV